MIYIGNVESSINIVLPDKKLTILIPNNSD